MEECGPSATDQKPTALVSSLAALVLRQAQTAITDNRIIAGVDRRYGTPIGLTRQDREAMSLVSRACLMSGQLDAGAEIYELLSQCRNPLGSWLPVREVLDIGLKDICLIDGEEGVPTQEACDLAADFSGQTSHLEELVFAKLMELLAKLPEATANRVYTVVRKFIVSRPLTTEEEIDKFSSGENIPSAVWRCIRYHFYEPVPFSWALQSEVFTCGQCGNAVKRNRSEKSTCRTINCNLASTGFKAGPSKSIEGLLRASRGIRQYWIEPGIDEIRLYDRLQAAGIKTELYPYRDRVDLSVGEIGIDLKSYASPELLGTKMSRSAGGLSYYKVKWLVIPDWLIAITPQYLDRLRHALGAHSPIRPLSVSEAFAELITHA